ncbi:MAG: DUF502 domain-containing protein [Schleiferiaceae bacterium]|jgi:uncharacterized membrane protein
MKTRLFNYFVQGLLYTTPLALTAYVLFWALSTLDSIIPFEIPGLGLLSLVAGITVIGFVGDFAVRSPLVRLVDRMLEQVPLVKLVYTSAKDMMKSLTGKKKGFEQAVLLRLNPDSELRRVGFVTDESLRELGAGQSGLITVYVPHSLAISGQLFVVPTDYVEPLSGKPSEVMKYIIAGGVVGHP